MLTRRLLAHRPLSFLATALPPSPSPPSLLARTPTLKIPFNVGWQDLKDLFRAAGSIIRADVKMNPDGTPTGTGTVVYELPQDAQNAIGELDELRGVESRRSSLGDSAVRENQRFEGREGRR